MATTALAGSLLAPAAIAQEGDRQLRFDDSTLLDQIVVTARRRDEALRDVPLAVDVQTGEQLSERGAHDAPAVLREVPGVYMPGYGDRTTSYVIMRGIGPILQPLSPDDSSVITFVDGTPLPAASSNSAYLDLERVEVIKGPQSTLFGRNTSGGAINLVPVMPGDTFEGYLRGEIGTERHRILEGAAGGPLIADTLGARVAFRLKGIDGYIDNAAGPELGAQHSAVGRLTLRLTPSDQTSWTVSASAESARGTPPFAMLKGDGFPILASQNLSDESVRNYASQSKFEHEFERFTFTSQTSYNVNQSHLTYDGVDGFLGNRISGVPVEFFRNPAINFFDWDIEQSRFTQEFRLNSAPGETVQWIAGATYYRDEADVDSTIKVFAYGPAAAGRSTFNQVTTGQAVFGEATYPITEKLKASLGGRYTWEQKKYASRYESDGTEPLAIDQFDESGRRNYNFWTGRASVSYDWTDEFMSYASIARGYKSGGYGTFNQMNWQGIPRAPYESSSSISYEAGARGTFLDSRLNFSAAAFYNDVSKEQILAFHPTTFQPMSLNLDTRSYGLEVDGSYEVTDNWSIAAGLTYTSTEIGNVSAAVAASQRGLKDGNRLPYVPTWAGRASLSYRSSLDALGFANAADLGLSARLGYNFVGSRYSDAGNLSRLDPVHLISARVALEWDNGEVYIFGENLLNKRYVTTAQPYGQSLVTGNEVFGASYSRGATIGIGAAVKF
ncbi:TonB-dependent receptor [Nitratireductor pacificus pht-3B]|uniref:TonB-dependent receptor n=1 Tax=Nitratireductor pacificus pht-3B TaxID=391937 RepID=K2MK07_9HYPH|nr:TonB-dependent receptor [Nitratireductor pacificus pht-3B]